MSIQEKRYNIQLAGEYFVAGELFRQGLFANVSFGNAKSFDILVFSKDKTKFAKIEVKSSGDPYFTRKSEPVYKDDHKFHFNIKAFKKEIDESEQLKKINKFYVFVVLNKEREGKPDFFIFEAQQIYDVMKKKIDNCEKKNIEISGRWDIKLSDIFGNKVNEKKNNWDCLKRFLNE